MNIIAIGINHKTAPIEVREKFYLNDIQQDLFLSQLRSDPGVIEAVILSTCNRIELYLNLLEETHQIDRFLKSIAQIKKITFQPELEKHWYFHKGDAAIEHLLNVSAGLDSLVIGEKQILGQVRKAFDRAHQRGILSKTFHILGNLAIRTGKKAQNETAICQGGSSISWAAITMAEKTLGNLKDKSAMILGAGKMSELTVEQISNKGFKNIFLMNRTQSNAEELAKKYNAKAVAFYDIKEYLSQVDLCICATDAPHYILDQETVQRIKSETPLLKLVLIDISMPRNIDPRVSQIPDVTLFYIDDLKTAIEVNLKKREDATTEVQKIVTAKLSEFHQKIKKTSPEDLPEIQYSLE